MAPKPRIELPATFSIPDDAYEHWHAIRKATGLPVAHQLTQCIRVTGLLVAAQQDGGRIEIVAKDGTRTRLVIA